MVDNGNISLEKIKQIIIPTLKQYDVTRAALFGSFVHGEQKEDSDVDILVEFNGEKSLFDLVNLQLDLGEVLGRPADVTTYDSLNHLIKDFVLKEQVVIL
jgi:predicted nucleotidyltransferase